MDLLTLIVIVLLVLWLAGGVAVPIGTTGALTLNNPIHLLLVIVVVLVLVRALR